MMEQSTLGWQWNTDELYDEVLLEEKLFLDQVIMIFFQFRLWEDSTAPGNRKKSCIAIYFSC